MMSQSYFHAPHFGKKFYLIILYYLILIYWMLQFNWIVVNEEFKTISEVPTLDWSLSSIGGPKCADLKLFIGTGTWFFLHHKNGSPHRTIPIYVDIL